MQLQLCKHQAKSLHQTGKWNISDSLRNLPCYHKELRWQVGWSIWMPAALTVWPNKTFKFLSMLIKGQYLAGFLMLVHARDKLTFCRLNVILVTPLPT